jgi:DNA-binding CsgD family transcriptional regulator
MGGTIASTDEGAGEDLARARVQYERRGWAAAHDLLSSADQTSPLGTADLERLALCSYMVGRDDEYLSLLQRLYRAYSTEGATTSAARSAFWLGLRLMFRGETAQSRGWLSRAERLVADEPRDSLERGYLLLAATQLCLGDGDLGGAESSASSALGIGERFAEADLIATARHQLGHVQIQAGNVGAGLSLFDETMVAVVAGELSPIVTGLIFCSVIEGCQEVHALDRAQEWTRALAHWCDGQPEMVAFAGICSVHRAELFELHGAWHQAFGETMRAMSRCESSNNRRAMGAARYRQGELHRLRGELELAESAFLDASEFGWEPQPGLALLRLAQSRVSAAVRSLVPMLEATRDESRRARLLPAYVEIMLAHGQCEAAAAACRELAALAERFESALLRAMAVQAQGEVELAQGDTIGALRVLRDACRLWEGMEAPYLAARVRARIAQCCRALQNEDGERLEAAAARATFERLGARFDISALGERSGGDTAPRSVLSVREQEVLGLVAAGRTNKSIAKALSLSEKTVERHVSNICSKLDVPSRTAATAYAYEHGLLGQ